MNKRDNTAIIYDNVSLGENHIIEAFAVLGIQDRFHPPKKVTIGDNAFFGSRCTVYAGVIAGNFLDLSDQSTIFTDNVLGHCVRIVV